VKEWCIAERCLCGYGIGYCGEDGRQLRRESVEPVKGMSAVVLHLLAVASAT
jgi:hypothetical protein